MDPSSHSFYSASFDKLIRHWDALTGRQIASFESSHTRPILALSLHTSSLFSCSLDGNVCIFDTASRECVRILSAPSSSPSAPLSNTNGANSTSQHLPNELLAMAVGLNVVYAGARDGSVKIWNISSGKLVKVLGASKSASSPSSLSTMSIGSSIVNALGSLVSNGDDKHETGSSEDTVVQTAMSDETAVDPASSPGSSSPQVSSQSIPKQQGRNSPSSLVEAVVGPIQRRASNLVLAEQFVQSAGSIITKTLFGDAASPSSGVSPHASSPNSHNFSNSASAVRTICVGVVPGQIFVAGDDAIIYEWDVKSGTIVRKFDSHSAGILWLHVEKPQENGSGGRLYSASLDGCVRVFDLEGSTTSQFQPLPYPKGGHRAMLMSGSKISRRISMPVLSSSSYSPHASGIYAASNSNSNPNMHPLRLHTPSPPASPTPSPSKALYPYSSQLSADDQLQKQKQQLQQQQQDASTIATLRAQLERAHALLSTQSQLTHKLKSELTVTRSHIATVKSDLTARQAEVSHLRAAGLERQVKRLEQEARDSRDAALVALEYITRQGSSVGLEIEVEVMGVMRLLESPWTPLNPDGDGLIGVSAAKVVPRFWESDSEFDSDVDLDLDETEAWWRIVKEEDEEERKRIMSAREKQRQKQAQLQNARNEERELQNHKRSTVTFKMDAPPLDSSDMNDDSTTEEEEDSPRFPATTDASLGLIATQPQRRSKRSHRWSTMSLTRPVLAYHESFRKPVGMQSQSPDALTYSRSNSDSEKDTEDENDAPLLSALAKKKNHRASIGSFTEPPAKGGLLVWSKGFLERIPEDDAYLEGKEDVFLARVRNSTTSGLQNDGYSRRSSAIDMIAMQELESASDADDAHGDGRRDASRSLYTAYDSAQTWPVSPVIEDEDDAAGTFSKSNVLPYTIGAEQNVPQPENEGVLKWQQQQTQETISAALEDNEEFSSILWNPKRSSSIKIQASRKNSIPAEKVNAADAILWGGPVKSKSPIGSTTASQAQAQPIPTTLPLEPAEAILFSGPVKSGKLEIPPTVASTEDLMGDAESVMWTGSVKSKKSIRKNVGISKSVTEHEAKNDLDEQDEEMLDAESVVFKGKVKSKKATAKQAKSLAGSANAADEDDMMDAESVVFRGKIKSKKSTAKQAKSLAGSIGAEEDQDILDDAESVVFKGKVKSKKATAKQAKSLAGSIGNELDLDDAESIVFQGPVKSKKSTKEQARSVNDGSTFLAEDAEAIMYRGSVRSQNQPGKSNSLLQDAESIVSEDAESVIWQGSVKSKSKKARSVATAALSLGGGGEFDMSVPSIPLPFQANPDLDSILWSGAVKSENRKSVRSTKHILENDPYHAMVLSPEWQPQKMAIPETSGIDSESDKPKFQPVNSNFSSSAPAFSPGISKPLRPALKASNGEGTSGKSTSTLNEQSGFGDFAKVSDQNATTSPVASGKGVLRTSTRPGPSSASDTLPPQVATPAAAAPPSIVPANQVKPKSSWLFSPISSIMQAVADQFVAEPEATASSGGLAVANKEESEDEEVSQKLEAPEPLSSRPASSQKSFPDAIDVEDEANDEDDGRSSRSSSSSSNLYSVRRSKSFDARMLMSSDFEAPSNTRRHSFHAIENFQLFDDSPILDDAQSEMGSYSSSMDPKSSVFTAPASDEDERPLTPTRTTSSYQKLHHEVVSSNNRIKKRGSVSSSLHASPQQQQQLQSHRYTSANTTSGTFKRPSLRPTIEDDQDELLDEEAVTPAVDKLAAAFESALEAAIERPWSLVPKWLVIDDRQQTQGQA
ncbi:hypothetical protein HDU78_002835 [Chytriomyces hyalinus]|nr:hypothetical protein HDU78_002835 [Chytriomyces hyalinus]